MTMEVVLTTEGRFVTIMIDLICLRSQREAVRSGLGAWHRISGDQTFNPLLFF